MSKINKKQLQPVKQQPIKILKVIIIGDSGVGKTNLLTTFTQGKFRQSYVATIGVDFKIKMLQIDGKKSKLQIWDTAGQQRFRNIAQTYYKGAAGIILAYSINSQISFRNINSWLRQIQSHANENVCKMLIATKSDLQSERQVTFEEGKALADKYGLIFSQVSAKKNQNVQQTFEELTRGIIKKKQIIEAVFNNALRLKQANQQDKKKCAC